MNISPKLYIIEDEIDDALEKRKKALNKMCLDDYGIMLNIEVIDSLSKLKKIKVDYNCIFLADMNLKDGGFSNSSTNGIDVIYNKVTSENIFIPCILYSQSESDSKFIEQLNSNDKSQRAMFTFVNKGADGDIGTFITSMNTILKPYFDRYFEKENIVGIMAREQSEIDRMTLSIIKNEIKDNPSNKQLIESSLRGRGCVESIDSKVNRLLKGTEYRCSGGSVCSRNKAKCFIDSNKINEISKESFIHNNGPICLDRKSILTRRNILCHTFSDAILNIESSRTKTIDIFKKIHKVKTDLKSKTIKIR